VREGEEGKDKILKQLLVLQRKGLRRLSIPAGKAFRSLNSLSLQKSFEFNMLIVAN